MRNIHGSVRIGGCGMATPDTEKVGLRTTIAFVLAATDCASAGRVIRIDVNHAYTHLLRFVADKLSQLPKRPGMAHTPLLPSNRHPLTNIRQIL
jgi:hypothetical protein